MKCPSCKKTMTKSNGPGEQWSCPCGSFVGVDRGAPMMDKPVDAHNQSRNITDEIDPDLHKKPEK
jgi:hypothetical protein